MLTRNSSTFVSPPFLILTPDDVYWISDLHIQSWDSQSVVHVFLWRGFVFVIPNKRTDQRRRIVPHLLQTLLLWMLLCWMTWRDKWVTGRGRCGMTWQGKWITGRGKWVTWPWCSRIGSGEGLKEHLASYTLLLQLWYAVVVQNCGLCNIILLLLLWFLRSLSVDRIYFETSLL